ncbi:flagellin [Natranaerovirga hydrolytica]|uniref:Flagellin n=1 Tax=Natranaerovirga hydrolytica TaxID=680378 RepID=A0A4R1N6A8_9FIRM|nr:flagellin [Natranaerovirga hydrolytica]TCL00076.1 flagellin [Natranaerovirga hydrolytica]
MRINHNIPALRSLNQLSRTNSSLDKTLERLSSGLRINRASDDAAGLAITQKMDTQIRGLNQANRNAMDGISLIQTAEGALSEVHAMLQRIRELSVQVSNGTYDEKDREDVQSEVNQLLEEIERISQDIEFNEKKLLNGDIDRRAFPENRSVVQIVSLSDTVMPGEYQITVAEDAVKAAIQGEPVIDDDEIGEEGIINLNGEEVKIEATDTADEVFQKLRGLAERVGADLFAYDNNDDLTSFEFDGETKLLFEMKEYGSGFNFQINSDNENLLNNLGLNQDPDDMYKEGKDVVAGFVSSEFGFSQTATVSSKGNIVNITDRNGFEMKFEAQDGAAGSETVVNVLDAGPLALQIGANEGQSMEIRVQNLGPKALGIDNLNLATAAGAQRAISIVSEAVNMVSSVRSKLGAYQNRLEHTVANLGVAEENLTASYSRILDADMAYEMSQYAQQNVLSQTGVSMLAQANQRPQSILQLLQG